MPIDVFSVALDYVSMIQRPVINEYDDYRKYLNDMYEYRKNKNVHFTFQHIANKTKTSRSYLKNVIDGRRHLSMDNIIAFADIFGVQGLELDLFMILVLKESTGNEVLKERFYQIMRNLKGMAFWIPKHFERMQDEGGDFCLTNALGGAIYCMAEFPNFQFQAEWILQHLNNNKQYSLEEVQQTMAKLQELGLIVEEGGKFKQGKEVSGVINPFNPKEAFKMYQPTASKLYDVFADVPAHGYIQVVSAKLSFGDKEMPELEAEFRRYKDRIEEISASSKNPNRVMGLSNNIYPLAHFKTE